MSIFEVVKARLGEPTGSGEWACPFCSRHGAHGLMAVRAEPPTFYCATCGHGGDAVKFVAMYDRISLPQAAEKLAGPQPQTEATSAYTKPYQAPDVVAKPRFAPELIRGKRSEKTSSS